MIKSVKRLGAAVLSAVMMLTAVATPLGDNLPAVRESTSLTASAASWPSDYRNWSQAASDNSMMRSYGCWVVAQAKLLQEIGATPSGFNPDSYLNWEKSNGYINSNFNQVNGVNAPCKYAQQQGKSLSYLGAISSNITSKIWDNINNGYYSIIYVKTSAGSSHYVMIGNALSKSNNAIWVYNSNTAQSSAKPTSLSSKNYTLKELYTYKSGSTPSTDNVKLLGISSKKSNTVSDTNAFVVTDVYKPSNYKLTKAGIRIRREDGTYDNGWSEFHNTASTWTGYDYMYISYDMNSEVKITLRHGTKYYYKFYAVIEGKEYWSPEQSFTTTGSHSYGSWYTKTSATCTSGGTEERKCSCGATESRSTSALGHNYGSTYFEADHPHKYAHLCQRCGYKEFTGGNLAIYEKCDICYNENLPSKPCLNISSNGFKESDNVSFTWDPTDKTTHYNLTVEVLSGDEYKTVCRQTYVNSGFQATFGKGQYRAVLDSYNSNMFHQYTSDWRDWVHNSSDYVYFDIECAHEFLEEVVSPTYDNEGYTLHKCTKCGYSYKDNYTPALKLTELTGVKVKTQGSTSLTLAWDKNANAKGYIIEQYKGGKWTQIAKTSSNTAVTYTVNGLAADTTYTFRIKAYVISGESEIYSDYVRIAGKTRIANVASFKGSAVSASAVKLD
ncbi:fibronectin type III domain protein, partial [[Eubacterium] siraeum DSM 15702]